MSDAQTVRVSLRPSLRLAIWFVVLHGGALIPLWSTGIPAQIAAAVTVAVLCHACWSPRRLGLLVDVRKAAITLAIDTAHRCAITLTDGRVLHGSVAESTLVTGRLIILAMRTRPLRPLSRVIVTADMCDRESFRRLRVLLMWSPGAGQDQSRKLIRT